jgi:DNA-directed RNA polymerase subunit RPC12/RpoP
MGMFDFTYFKCPKCGEITEDQSKASDCNLDRYYFGDIAYEVPLKKDEDDELISAEPVNLEILAEASKYGLVCEHCNHKFKPKLNPSYTFVPFEED